MKAGSAVKDLISSDMIDWSQCPDAERIPGKVAWLIKGTRIRLTDLFANLEDLTPEEVDTDCYPSIGLDRMRRIMAFAEAHGGFEDPD